MNHTRVEPAAYDRISITLHWITAVLVLLLWCLGQTVDWFPADLPRIAARSTHIVLGAALGLVVCFRIWWRAARGARLPPPSAGWPGALRNSLHIVLYLLLAGVVALGLFNAWERGDTIFRLFRLPSFDPGNKALRHQVEDLHGLAANVLLALAALHACVALTHHFVLRDRVLRRMWPQGRGNPAIASRAAAFDDS
jgi:cytochrome b561